MKKLIILSVGLFCLAVSAGLDKELGKKFLPAASDMLTFTTISQKLHEMDVDADLAWTRLADRNAYDVYRKQMYRKMMAAMGEWPERTSLNARTVATFKRDGYRIEKVIFESMPKLFVTANLFIPDDPKFTAPYPAVVLSCGHSGDGKDCNIYLRACVHAVRNGFVALMYDPYEQGERKQFKGIGSTGHHNIIGVKASLIGWSMPMLRTWDGMRAVDYVESRAEVDKDRIGFMGQSGGGTMTALMTAADWRLKATAPSCYLTSLRHLCESMGPQDAEQNIFGQLAFGLNHTGYVLLPDTKVAVTCRFRDMFSIYGTLDLFRTVKTLAAKIGTYDHYALKSAPGPHGWTESTEVASIDWMRAWLKDETEVLPLDCTKYRPLDIGFDVKTVELGLSEEEFLAEQDFWAEFVKGHIPEAYGGIGDIMRRFKAEGGFIAVASHSYTRYIERDYKENSLPEADAIYSWDLPKDKRKPHPFTVLDIMSRYGFSRDEILVVDDLKPGFDMARAAGVDFCAAGWAYDVPEIEAFMREGCDFYCKSVAELHNLLFGQV